MTVARKYYAISVCKNLEQHAKRFIAALIVEVDESICLEMQTNKAKKFVSKFPKKKYLILEEV
jgi:hypothetical protein